MQFEPEGVVHISEIEKGSFISYEVKSCKADYNSGFGQNFETEKNYFVMPMNLYKELCKELNGAYVGVMCLVPLYGDVTEEFENPTPLSTKNIGWELKNENYCVLIHREWRLYGETKSRRIKEMHPEGHKHGAGAVPEAM